MARILVVDDDPDVRRLVAQALSETGHEVVTAANGAEALDQMNDRRPDAVVLDLIMPVLDGAGFLRECRADPALVDLPVALFTTAFDGDRVARDLEVQARIPKPFDLDELMDVVDRLAGEPRPKPTPRASIPVEQRVFDTRMRSDAMRSTAVLARQELRRSRSTADTAAVCLQNAAARLSRSRRLLNAS